MTVLHSFNYIDINYNTTGTITIQMVNQLSNMLGVQNLSAPANLQNAINLLIKDYNFFTLLCQLESLIKKHSDYDSSNTTQTDNGSALYDTDGNENSITNKFSDVSVETAYTYLFKSEQLLTLSNSISQNNLLRNNYIMSTNKNIGKKLLSFRNSLQAYTGVSTTSKTTEALNYDDDFTYGFCPLFNVWASAAVKSGYTATTYATSIKAYITPLKGSDITFLRFFYRIIYMGIQNLLSDVDNQNVIVNYGIDKMQIMDALAGALDVPVFSDSDKDLLTNSYDFLLFASTVQRILTICIPIINDIKNKVMMNGLPSYYIVYCLFLICMLNSRNDMITIASLNLDTLTGGDYGSQLHFYATETSNVYSVDLTVPTSNILFVQLGFI